MKNQLQIEISIPQSKSKSFDPRTISITRTSISIGKEALQVLGLTEGLYIMIGHFGKDLYFAKRPLGQPGYRVFKSTRKTNRLNCSAVDIQKNFPGTWELSPDVIEQEVVSGLFKVCIQWRKAVKQ